MAIKTGISIIVKLGSLDNRRFVANCVAYKWKEYTDRKGIQHAGYWYYCFIPGMGYQWLPDSYLVSWA